MIEFNQLEVMPDNQGLYIDTAIEDMPYFEDCFIDSIQIDTGKKYTDPDNYVGPLFTWKNTYYTLLDLSVSDSQELSSGTWATEVKSMLDSTNGTITNDVIANGTRVYAVVTYNEVINGYTQEVLNTTIGQKNSGSIEYMFTLYLKAFPDVRTFTVRIETRSGKPEYTVPYMGQIGLKIILVPENSSPYLVKSNNDLLIDKEVRLLVPPTAFEIGSSFESMQEDIFFVTVTAKGTPAEDTPCEIMDSVIEGCTFSMCKPYNRFMQYIRELSKSCEIPMNLIDQFLRFKAITANAEMRNYSQAAVYHKKFFENLDNVSVSTSKCGCNA